MSPFGVYSLRRRGIEPLIPAEAVEGEVRAAVEAGGDLDFCIIARTTAIRQVSFARAVERGNASLVFRENLNVSCGI